MTAQPPSNADFAEVCRDYSPAHAAVFLIMNSQPDWSVDRYANFLGMTATALIHLAEHLSVEGLIDASRYHDLQPPTIPPTHHTHTDEHITNIFAALLGNNDICRLVQRTVPASKYSHYLMHVATLCADSEVKNPITYAKAIIRNYHKEPLYADDPESRAQQGRTPVVPG